MGTLQPRLGNANYATCGQLSPLLNDPYYESIGIGTKIFLGGGIGYIAWQGTQHNPNVIRGENGVPKEGAGTVAVIGDLKQMSPDYLKGVSMAGYGVSLGVGIGVPIPILNKNILKYTTVRNEEIYTQIVDYSEAYPKGISESLGEVNYAQLNSGKIVIKGKEVPTGCLSSYAKAKKIANTLREWIKRGDFLLTQSVQPLPSVGSGITFKLLKERPLRNKQTRRK